MDYQRALEYLNEHVNYDTTGRIESPTLDRIAKLLYGMADPQLACPWITVTGTNGKGSTSKMISALIAASDLSVGTYNSPHLQRINERISRNSVPVSDEEFARAISDVANIEPLMGITPSYFEILTAAAFGFFADAPVDVGVLEVGLGGTWDATTIADAGVAVVTNVAMDHMEFLGPTRAHIARDKAGIVKEGALLVLGETDPELLPIFQEVAAGRGAAGIWLRGDDFDCVSNDLAVGGRLLTIRTPGAIYNDVFLPLHGAHQGDNAALALAASEAFFGGPVEESVVLAAFAEVTMPGRFEVVARNPLIVIDGAHNPAGAAVAATTLADDFLGDGQLDGDAILVVGQLAGRDPVAFLEALDASQARLVICTQPPSERALPAQELANAAESIGCVVRCVPDLNRAIELAIADAGDDDAVLITGSLYTAGAARTRLVRP